MALFSVKYFRRLKRRYYYVLIIILLFAVFSYWYVTRYVFHQKHQSHEERCANMPVAIVYSDDYQINLVGLERLHSFDIHKYRRIYKQLIEDGLLDPDNVCVPASVTEEEILRVHTPAFLESLQSPETVAEYLEAPVVGLIPGPALDKSVLLPFRFASGGTLLAARHALQNGIAINIGGGYHHAKPHKGEGFCIYADMPIAIRALQVEGKIRRSLVIDLDAHQGNGTAICLANDSDTFTFSMHQGDIYPIPKETSDIDIELDAGTNDDTYLDILSKHLPTLFDRFSPDLVFLQAGCDTLIDDPLSSLIMTENGIVKRDAMVIDACVQRKLPVIMTLGGGYSQSAWHAQYASIRNIIETYGHAVQDD